jgi:chemotaxis protein histidine kinase CheA
MSDEFLEVAAKEIREELRGLEHFLALCKTDRDVIAVSSKFQKHTHKIKGLAPMMDKKPLGDISNSLDLLFKQILDGKDIEGILTVISEIIPFMKSMMNEPEYDSEKVKEKISKIETLSN